jgi:hypothetical protein
MKQVKRILITVLGGTVLAAGVALIVLPGPAFIVIPLGLAILAIEFAWARRWLRSARTILPLKSKPGAVVAKKRITSQSIRRSISFLLRQVRRAVLPGRTPT